jgi:hypothetical protein
MKTLTLISHGSLSEVMILPALVSDLFGGPLLSGNLEVHSHRGDYFDRFPVQQGLLVHPFPDRIDRRGHQRWMAAYDVDVLNRAVLGDQHTKVHRPGDSSLACLRRYGFCQRTR